MKVCIEHQAKGNYILLIEIPQEVFMKVGALGVLEFHQGFYAYCGSAMGGLGVRINRHLSRVKRVRWHIDYLIEQGMVRSVIYAPTNERFECQLAKRLGNVFHSFSGFGSSDCRCPGHLFFSEELQELREQALENFIGLLKGGAIVIEDC